MDMLLDTLIVSFSPEVSMVGTFIILDPMDPYNISPLVDWFIEYGVPVWYEWNPGKASDLWNAHFAPLDYQLQEAVTFRTKSVFPVPSSPITVHPLTFLGIPPSDNKC